MVAVIAGNGLGLGNTSLTQLGQGLGSQATIGQGNVAQVVNSATGNLVLQTQDEGLVFDGLSLNVLRTYNSQGQLTGSAGWQFGFSRSIGGLTGTLDTVGSTVTRTADDGSAVVYVYNATLGAYVSSDQSGAADTLSWSATASSWTWNDAAASQSETYNASGQLTALSDTQTGASYSFSYTSNNQLSQIVAGDGDTLVFGYNTANQLISLSIQEVPPGQTTAVTRQQVSYAYDSQGRLSTVTTLLASDTDSSTASYTTTYTYSGSSDRVASVSQTDGTTVSYSYTEDAQGVYQVTGITTGTGAAAQVLTLSYGTDSTTVTNALGNATTYNYNAAGELTAVIAPTVNGITPTTRYTYDANGNLLTSTDANGAVTSYSYDANGNLLSVEDGAGNTVSYTYNADDQVLSQTTYTVPAQGEVGQPGYVPPSGAQTTYDVYNAADQLAYVIDALGNVTQNTYTTTGAGISVLSSTQQYLGASYSLSGLSPSTPPTLAALQNWVASSAVQSTLSQSTRTDYTYDARGQLATQTQWDMISATGTGVSDAGTVITTTTYSAQGQLLQTSTQRGSVLQTTSYAYDGLGRLISSTDPLGNVTSYVYTDSSNTLAITQANGLTTTQVRNSAGQLISSTQMATGQTSRVTSYLYNAAGQQVATIDPAGNVSYIFYNADGEVTGTVDATGAVTAYTYDADGHVIGTTQYATLISSAGWVSAGVLTSTFPVSLPIPAESSSDLTTTTIYDAAGDVVASIDPAGNVTTTSYNGDGDVTVTTTYATPLTAAQLTALGDTPTLAAVMADITPSANDRTTATLYDADNRPVATIDPTGAVTVVSYDAIGDVTSSSSYATPLTAAQITALIASPSLAVLQVLLTPSQQTIYNTNHQPVATIGASGEVTVTEYDGNGNVKSVTAYADPLSLSQIVALGIAPTLSSVLAAVTSSTNDATSLTLYDANDNPVTTVTATGVVTENIYDASRNVISTTVYANALTAAQIASLGDAPTLSALQALIVPSANDQTTYTIYNAIEQLVATVSSNGLVTTTTYDTSGNVVSATQYATALNSSQIQTLASDLTQATLASLLTSSADDQTTVTLYDDQGRTAAVVSPSGEVTLYNYQSPDSSASITLAQELTSVQLQALYQSPTLLMLDSEISPAGAVSASFSIYDSNNRLVATVSSSGVVNTISYDANGNIVSKIQYANAITAAQIQSLGTEPTLSALDSLLTQSNSDSASLTIYDQDERVVATVSTSGVVDTTTYDANGNVTASVQYATPLSALQVESLGSSPTLSALEAMVTPSVDDSAQITIYDAQNRVIAEVSNTSDGGYLDTTSYDENGNADVYAQYGTSLTATQLDALSANPTMPGLLSLVSSNDLDRWTISIYNSSNQVVGEVSSSDEWQSSTESYAFQYYATTFTQNAQGEQTSQVNWYTPLTLSQVVELSQNPTLQLLQSMVTPSPYDYASVSIYDDQNRDVAEVGDGYVNTTTYDAAGNVIASVEYGTSLTMAQVESLAQAPTLSNLQSLVTPGNGDRIRLTIYNADEQLVATVTPEEIYNYSTGSYEFGGQVAVNTYDTNGNLIATTTYATQLTPEQVSSLGDTPALSDLEAVLTPTLGDQVALTLYNVNNQIVATVGPQGNVTMTTNDAAGNVLFVREYATDLTSAQLAALGDNPTLSQLQADVTPSSSDLVTLYLYDANERKVATVTPYYVYDPSRSTYGYGGLVSTTSYNSAGGVIDTLSYGTPITESQLASLGDSPTLSALQALLTPSSATTSSVNIYDADNQLVASVNETYYVNQYTGSWEYGFFARTGVYDSQGQIGWTAYANPLDAAQVDALGLDPTLVNFQSMVTPSVDDETSISITNGSTTTTVTPTESYSWSMNEWVFAGRVTSTTYNANGNVIEDIQYGVELTAQQADALANDPTQAELSTLVAPSDGDLVSMTVQSSDGSQVATVQPAYYSYDPTIGAYEYEGRVTITTYDSSGRQIAATVYANQLTVAQMESLENSPTFSEIQSLVSPSVDDQTNVTIYGANGNVVANVSTVEGYDSETSSWVNVGQATTYTYDADGNSIASVVYGNLLSPSQMASLAATPTLAELNTLLSPGPADQRTLTIYNADEQVVATITPIELYYDDATNQGDFGGSVTINSYDAYGNVAGTITYGTSLTAAQMMALGASPTLSQLQAMVVPSSEDTASVTIYNGNHQVIASVTEDGAVSTTSYDAYGNVISSTQYAIPLTLQQAEALANAPTLAALESMLILSSNDQSSVTIYGNNEQILAYVSPQGIATVMTYDANGNQIEVQQYATPLNYAQVSELLVSPSVAALMSDLEINAGDGISKTFYNASGQVLATVSSDGDVVANTYDNAGNLTSSTQYALPIANWPVILVSDAQLTAMIMPSAGDLTSRTIYNADSQPVANISVSGQVTLTTYDTQGDAVSTTTYATPLTSSQMASLGVAPTLATLQALLNQTSHTIYNVAGEPVVSIDAEGNATYSFYNDAGQLAEVIDPDGAVTTYSYDADGNLTQTVQFATVIDTSGWLTSAGQLSSNFPTSLPTPPSTSNDRITTRIYNAEDQVVATIDSAGAVAINTYDAFGEMTSSTHYATVLTSAQVAALGSAPTLAQLTSVVSASAQDSTTITIYDADGNAAATIDPDGYVTMESYDAGGDVVLETQYATALTAEQLAQLGDSPSLASLQTYLVSSPQDQVTRSYYDGTSELVAQIDADGYLDVVSHDAQTNTTVTTRYATALTSSQLTGLTGNESVTELVALLGENTQNEQTSATYNAEGQLVSATVADGTVTRYTYDDDGRVTSTTITPVGGQGAPRTTSVQYDAFGNLVASMDADGNTTTYAYNADNQRMESTDPNGNSTWYYYDADGRLLYTIEGQPDSYGDLNAQGNVTAYTYDAFGDVTSTTVYASQLNLFSGTGAINPSAVSASGVTSALASLTTSALDTNEIKTATYTLAGQAASVTDGDGYVTNYSYDAFGDRIEAQQQVSDAGQPVTAADSTVTTYDYDADGRLVQEADGVASNVARTTSSAYDAFGRVISTTDGDGNTTFYSFDNLDQQIGTSQVVQGVTRTTETTYGAFGDVLSTTDALGNVTHYQYDITTHTTVVTSPDDVVATTVKDAFGDVLSVTDGEGDTTSYTYDADGNVLSTTDALGNVSTDQYDADGNLVLTTDPDGDEVSYTYDAGGRVLSRSVDPNGLDLETDYTYDGIGREISINDPMGVITNYAYDADGNVLSEVQDAGFTNQTTTYTYDGAGNVLTETQGAGTDEATTTQYVYDALGRLSEEIVDPNGLNLVMSHAYDADNNLVATTDPNGDTSYTIYNEANEAVYTVIAAGASGTGEGVVTQNWYDADGNVVSTRVYASIVSSAELAGLAGSGATPAALAIGSQLAASAATGSDPVSYTVYNAAGQVIYQIDPLGNVTETRYDALGQVSETLAYASPLTLDSSLIASLQSGTAQPSDIQAALQEAGDSDNTARVTYDFYDADGRLAFSVTPNLVDGVPGGVVNQIEYDAAGRVIANATYGVPLPLTDLGAGATTSSITQAVAQLNTSSTTRVTQYFYNTAGEQAAETDPNGNTSYTFYDADGNIVATVDATGAVVQYLRDDLGRVIQQISYSTTVDTSGWLVDGVVSSTSNPIPPSSSGDDRLVVTTYDALGRVSTVSKYSQVSVNNQWVQNPNGTWTYITTTTPTDGDTLTYVYDADSRVIQTIDADLSDDSANRVTNYFYDADGNNIAISNADGYLTTYAYDAAGNLVQTVAYANEVGSYTGGGLASILPASSPNDEITTNYYDALGRLIGTLDGDGYFTQYTYDSDGQQLSVTRYTTASDLGPSASFEAIAQALAGTAGHQTINTYDSYGDLLSSEDYEGTVTTYTYNDLGNVVQTTVAAGTSDARTTSSTYDAFGNVVSTTDGLGNVTTYTYDLAGNKTSMTDALGNTTWYVYDVDNRLVYTIRGVDDGAGTQNSMGEVNGQGYDTFGDVVDTVAYSDRLTTGTGFVPTLSSVQTAVNAISSEGPDWDNWVDYTYDLEGNVVGKNDGNSNETNYTYDGFNEVESVVDPDTGGLTTLYTYDGMGNMTSRVDEAYEEVGNSGEPVSSGEPGSSGEYDFASILIDNTIVGSGCGEQLVVIRTQEWTYDAFGNVATYTDGDGNTTSYNYDDLNQQVMQSLAVSGVNREAATSYDAYGRVLSTTDAMGLVTTYSYNDADRTMTETTPGGVSTTTAYNREGQKIAVTDADGNTTSDQYDADGNLIETVNPDGSTITNQYDADGNLIQATDADGNVTAYTYDAAGRVLTEAVDPNGLDLVTSYTYDGRGLMISKTDPAGVTTTYSYDGNGNLTYMDQDAGGDSDYLDVQTSYSYNDLNEVAYTLVSKDIDGTWQSSGDSYAYDALGRMNYESTDTGHVTEIQSTYDADGNVTSQTDGNGNITYYYYNEADQLTYEIAPNGAVAYTTYNPDGQVTSVTQYAIELSQGVLAQIIGDGSWYLPDAIQASADDRTAYNVYNGAGQLAYTIDAAGAVTETLYNTDGQVAETLADANLIDLTPSLMSAIQGGTVSDADMQSALSAAGDSAANARITYTYYDDMGRVSSTLSSATLNGQSGYLAIQTQYDADGNVIAKIQSGDLIPASVVGGTSSTATVEAYLGGLADIHVARTVYDAAGRAVYAINAANDVTQTEYDADSRVIAILQYANPIATPAAWTQADVAAAVQATNADSSLVRETQNTYDALGNLIEATDCDGNVTSYTYDERGLKLSSTDGNGNTTTYAYDSYGNLLTLTGPPVAVASYSSTGVYQGTTTESIVTAFQYDNDGNLIEETDASNTAQARTTQYVYDSVGNLIQTIQADPGVIDPQTGLLVATGTTPTAATTYDAFGDAVVSEDADGNYTYNVYDQDGRLAYAIDGDGYVTGYQYNAYGQQTAVTRYADPADISALGAWSAGYPLSMEQMQSVLVTSAKDRTITTTYDAQGNKLSVTQPSITYTDSDGTTATGSPVTQYTYDAYGNVTSESVLLQGAPGQADAVWATTYNYYDALNRVVKVVVPAGSYTNPQGYVTTNAYDAFGDVVSTTQWATAISTGELAAGGTPPSDPASTGTDRTTIYTYDNDGNKTSESASGIETTFGYNADNQLTTIDDNGNTVTTAYDALGRVSSVTGPQMQVLVSNWQALLEANSSLDLSSASLYTSASQVMSYAYDALGNKLVQTQSSTYSTQSVSTYSQYDSAGNMVAELTPLGGSTPNWTSTQAKYMTYDANGNLLQTISTLDGDDGTTVTVTTSNVYDADNQLIASTTMRSDAVTPDKSVSTQYDAFGEVTATGDGIVTSVTNTYDNAGNLLTTTDPTTGELHAYGYNLAGQRLTDTVPLAAAAGGTASTVDTRNLDGQIIAEQAPSTNSVSGENAGTLVASYDRWGNVLSSTDAAGNTTTYTYNQNNQVLTQTEAAVAVVGVNGVSTETTPVKTSSYDANGNLIATTDEDGNTTTTVVSALGQTMETIDGTGAVSYIAYDALGNDVAQEDGNGNITFTNVDALGRVVQQGDFVAAGTSRTAVWQQAYVLDQNGDKLITYDGIGSAYLQSGDTTDAALHANYYGYDSQGRVLWSQDAAQRAASLSDAHGPSAPGNWTQAPTNADFSQGDTGWNLQQGWSTGNFGAGPFGTWGAAFTGTSGPGSGEMVNQDRVPVVPGQAITASAAFDVVGEHGGGAVSIVWYDANGNAISTALNNNIISAGDGPGVSTVTATAPPGAAYAAISIGATNYDIGSTVYAANVSWNYVPPAGATSTGANGSIVVWLPNGSFTQQPNNPDFENGDSGWDKGTGWTIVTASNASNGSWVGAYNGNGSALMVNQDRVPVTAGQTISASVQVSLYLSSDGAAAAGAVVIQWFDAAGNLIGNSVGNVVSTDRVGRWEASTVTAGAPAGAAYAALAVSGSANGIGGVEVDAAKWNYQYIPAAPTGVVQDTYVYNMDGSLASETTADGDTETWQYNAYGQATTHTDLSGALYNYTYDANTGLLIGESDNWSPTAQGQATPLYVTAPITTPNSSTDTYYADGQLATQTYSDGSSYSYSYDANGNQTRVESTTVDGNDQPVHTVTTTTYDSHNRISNVVEINVLTGATTLDETFSYDAAGNRREVSATSGGTATNAWYTYDGDNRVVVSAGSLVSGQIVVTDTADSYAQTYDADGNVISQLTVNAAGDTLVQQSTYDERNELIRADYAVDVTTGGASNGVEETISYDADGHALITDTYYALGTTLDSLPTTQVNPDDAGVTAIVDGGSGTGGSGGGGGADVGGELDTATIDYYDAVGRLADEQDFGNANGWDGSGGDAVPTTAPGEDASSFGSLALQTSVVYQGVNGSAGYDADGDVVSYQYRNATTGEVDQYAVTYLRKDTYLQSTTSGQNISDTPNVQPATDESVYDTRGNLVALEQHTQYAGGTVADTVHVFAYDGNGQIIERQDGTGDGATLNQGSTPALENQHYVYVNGQQVAHYDDAGTLDVLDEVTAFSSNTSGPSGYVVQAGDTLESIAQAEYGDVSLWYVIAQANALSGDNQLAIGQSLTIPQITTHSNTAATFKPYDPSSIVGSTTPSLPTIAPPPPPSSSGCNVLAEIIVIAVTVVATVLTEGATSGLLADELGTLGSAVLSGAIAGAAGSVAGQLTGEALGTQQGFSWSEVGDSALAAGLTAGIGSAGGVLGAAEQGAINYAATDVVDKLTGQPGHFSWAGLVASSLGSAAYGAIQASPLGDTFTGGILARATDDVVDREASVALGDNDVPSWQQVGEDVGGTAVGSAGIMGIQAYQQNQLANQPNQPAATSTYDPNNPLTTNNAAGIQALSATTPLGMSVSNDGQAALGTAWQQTQSGIDGDLDAESQADESNSYPSDQDLANYMSGVEANPQAMLAYAPPGAANGGNGSSGLIGPPSFMPTDGDPIYAAAAAASGAANAYNSASSGSSTAGGMYQKEDANIYSLAGGTQVQVADPGTDSTGATLSSNGIVIGQQPYEQTYGVEEPIGYTGYVFYTSTQSYAYQYPVGSTPGPSSVSGAPSGTPDPSQAQLLPAVNVTGNVKSDNSLPPIDSGAPDIDLSDTTLSLQPLTISFPLVTPVQLGDVQISPSNIPSWMPMPGTPPFPSVPSPIVTPAKFGVVPTADTGNQAEDGNPLGIASKATSNINLGSEEIQTVVSGIGRWQAVKVLSRAASLQSNRITAIINSRELDDASKVVSESSKSGLVMAKYLPIAKALGHVANVAQIANVGLEVAAAPSDQKARVLAKGAANAAAETIAVAGAFEVGAAVGLLIPIPVVGSLLVGTITAGLMAAVYHLSFEEPVNKFIDDTIDDTNRDIDEMNGSALPKTLIAPKDGNINRPSDSQLYPRIYK